MQTLDKKQVHNYFSVIIPLYNKEDYVGELLKACLKLVQICDHVKSVIIIDDCSADSSLNVVSNFIENCESNLASRFVVHKMDVNSGPQLARIKGAELAQSEWIMLVDADDLIYPYSVAKVWDYIMGSNSHLKDIGLIYGNCPRTEITTKFNDIKDAPHKKLLNIRLMKSYTYVFRSGYDPLMSGLFIRCKYVHLMNNMLSNGEDILFFFELFQYTQFLYLDIDIALYRLQNLHRSTGGINARIILCKSLFRVKIYKNTGSLHRTFEATIVRFRYVRMLVKYIYCVLRALISPQPTFRR